MTRRPFEEQRLTHLQLHVFPHPSPCLLQVLNESLFLIDMIMNDILEASCLMIVCIAPNRGPSSPDPVLHT